MKDKNKIYSMPELNEDLLKQVIFSMENQKTNGYLDLFNCTIVDVLNNNSKVQVASDNNIGHFEMVNISDYQNRFVLIPTWRPLEGFKMRENFVNELRNPLYKERLNKVLHTGRGVFKKFKEVIHSNSAIERQWYSYKESYMKNVVIKWYELHEGAINLEQLPLDIEELPDDLLMNDFQLEFYKNDEKIEEINKIKEFLYKDLSKINQILIKERLLLKNNTKHLCVLTPEDKIVGYIEYKNIDNEICEILSYGIIPDYRGIGLFGMMIDKLVRQLNREKYKTILLFILASFSKKTLKIKNYQLSCNLGYCLIDIKSWIDTNASSELLDV